jgi:hypothetical protein
MSNITVNEESLATKTGEILNNGDTKGGTESNNLQQWINK